MFYTDIMFYPKIVGLLIVLAFVQLLLHDKEILANQLSKTILLIYSVYALAEYDIRFVWCMISVVCITYISAIQIDISIGKRRSIWTKGSIIVLVLVLGVFKYFNFFIANLGRIAGRELNNLSLFLPLGISFYIFSAISYLLDVSWGSMKADTSILNVSLFICFFPKLVCGPIVKGREFIPQLQEYRCIKWNNVCIGIQIFVFGLFKKIVLADHLALFVDEVYSNLAVYGTVTIWLTVFSYVLQLYFDFSGYSDMAIGLFRILGYDVAPNFNLPFVATTISEFWNRWHISLGEWLTEYVFNPIALHFKRKMTGWTKETRKKYKMLPTYATVIITFLISGVWHGAGWTFVIFGLLHGSVSVVQQMYAKKVEKKEWVINKKRWLYVLDILLSFLTITVIEVLFRAENMEHVCRIFHQMFSWHVGVEHPYTWSILAYCVLIIATIVAYRKCNSGKLNWNIHSMKTVKGYYLIQDLSTIKGLTFFFILCGLTIILGYFGETYFIYGQF